MAFNDNSYYPNRKDWRKPYRGAGAYTRGCRNHGSCGYCKENRTHFDEKRRDAADRDLKEAEDGIT